jgi:hypothetical protein
MAKFRVIEAEKDKRYYVETLDVPMGSLTARWRPVGQNGDTYSNWTSNIKENYCEYHTLSDASDAAKKFAIDKADWRWVKLYVGPGGRFWVVAKDDNRAVVRKETGRFAKWFPCLDNTTIVNAAGVADDVFVMRSIWDAVANAKRLASGKAGVVFEVASEDVIKLTLSDQRYA